MTSEATIQEKIQAVIQDLAVFADADVVINDWSIFDRPNVEAPYVLIEASDDFRSEQQVMTAQTTYGIPIVLVEAFMDWKETFDNFQLRRQAIIDVFNGTGDSRTAAGLNIAVIRNDGGITPWYDKLIPEDQLAEALPSFIMQRIILEANTF